jgi:hypothetical protein
MAIEKYLKDGEWWDLNAPKPAVVPARLIFRRSMASCDEVRSS